MNDSEGDRGSDTLDQVMARRRREWELRNPQCRSTAGNMTRCTLRGKHEIHEGVNGAGERQTWQSNGTE